MAYSDYTTLHKLNKELGITHQRQKLFVTINPVLPSTKLMEDLQEARDYYRLEELWGDADITILKEEDQ